MGLTNFIAKLFVHNSNLEALNGQILIRKEGEDLSLGSTFETIFYNSVFYPNPHQSLFDGDRFVKDCIGTFDFHFTLLAAGCTPLFQI